MMEDERMTIIRTALASKLGNGFSMFTHDEVLIAAGLTDQDLEALQLKHDQILSQAAEKAERTPLKI